MKKKWFETVSDESIDLANSSKMDPLSSAIFLEYASHISVEARRSFNAFLRSNTAIPDAIPFTKYCLSKKNRKKPQFHGGYIPADSPGLFEGYGGQGLRAILDGLEKVSNKTIIEESIRRIDSMKTINSTVPSHYWLSYIPISNRTELVPGINLGITSGMTGIILYLSLCYSLSFCKKKCLKLVTGAVNQILEIDLKTGCRGLPRVWGPEIDPVFIPYGIQYGDAVTGYAIVLAGVRCQNSDWIKEGSQIFKRGLEGEYLKLKTNLPFLGSGAAGIALLALRFSQITGDSQARREGQRWLNYANKLYVKKFKNSEMKLVQFENKSSEILQPRLKIRGNLLTTSMGLMMVNWSYADTIDSRWDSILGLSNPVTGKVS